jgi:serine/threonine protein kinase/Tol biopolymer transport system component
MKREPRKKAEELFHAALEREPSERAAFLERACAGDEALLRDVTSLLRADERAGRFIEEPAVDAATQAASADESRLSAGAKLGPYEILAPLGAGGMGEVYRARDPRLKREVALKVLPADLASKPERLERFQREAETLAALNHPHIVTIFSVEEANGLHFLTMELVEGKTLTRVIPRSGLSLPRFFRIAIPLTEAVAAAHEKGITHRDLKPGNVMVTEEDRIKVLDFGLAKLRHEPEATGDSAASTEAATGEGRVLGTAPYMSPEQVQGKAVDHRSDVFSLGILLYEMVTGDRPFQGDTPAEVASSILREAPEPVTDRKADLPRDLGKIIRRCLEKEPRKRFQSTLDLANELEELRREVDSGEALLSSGAPITAIRAEGKRRVWLVGGAVVAALAAVAVTVVSRWNPSEPAPLPRLANAAKLTAALGVEDYPTWSPDGRTLAYQSDQAGNWDIWVTQVGSTEAVNRTADSPADDIRPSWSPDGRWIAFFSQREGGGYFVMPAVGGTARKVASWPPGEGDPTPAAWSPDSTQIVYARGQYTEPRLEILMLSSRVSKTLPLPARPRNNTIRDLSWSPDGRWLAYARSLSDRSLAAELWVTRPSDGESFQLTGGTSTDRSPTWSDSRELHFVSDRGGAGDLWRHTLGDDLPEGDPQQVTVGIETIRAAFSADGRRLAYTVGRSVENAHRVPLLESRPTTWMDATQLTFDEANFGSIDVSHDGRLVFSSHRGGNSDLWTLPVVGSTPQQLTTHTADDFAPRWKPDGSEVLFCSLRTGHREVWVVPVGGGPARQVTRGESESRWPDWAPSGMEIAKHGGGLFIVPAQGGEERRLTSHPEDHFADWSPDGRWVVFSSARDGTRRVWRVPASGGRAERLTEGAGLFPRWSRDGKQIYFIGAEERRDNVWVLSLETREERPVTALTGRPGRLGLRALATDGQSLYFAWEEPRGDIWVADIVQPPGQ